MNKAEREIYVELTSEISATLCLACKFTGGGYCDSWDGCKHPLNKDEYTTLFHRPALYWDDDIEPGEDCWAFRPCMSIDILADLAGCILGNGFGEWFCRLLDDGNYKVYGNSYRSRRRQYAEAQITIE